MLLFVGIDPGTTSAVALVDAESGKYKIISQKEFSKEEMEEKMVGYGDPVVISSDVGKVPDIVESICSTFGSRCFSPGKDLVIKKKKELTKNHNYSNDHERDALASALYAKKNFQRLMNKVDSELEKRNKQYLSKAVKKMVLKNEAPNIETAINSFSKKETDQVRVKPEIVKSKKIIEQRNLIKKLRKEKEQTERKNRKLERKINKLESKLRRKQEKASKQDIIALERALESKKQMNKRLKRKFQRYKNRKKLENDNYILTKVESTKDISNIKNRPVLLNNMDIFRQVDKEKPLFIIADTKKQGINTLIINRNNVNIKHKDNIIYVDKEKVEELLEQNKKFENWLETYKKRFKEN